MTASILDTPGCRPILELGVGGAAAGIGVGGQGLWHRAQWQAPGAGSIVVNQLTNGQMDQPGTGGLAFGWSIPARPASCTTTSETIGAVIAPFQRIVTTLTAGQQMNFQQSVAVVTPSKPYRLRADVKGALAGATFAVVATIYNAANAIVGSFTNTFTLSASWATRQIDFNTAVDAAYAVCQFRLTGAATSATLDIDNVLFGIVTDTTYGTTNAWAGTEPTWTDIACDVITADSFLGRERATDPIQVGTMQFTVRNDNGAYDVNSDEYLITVRPGRQIRMGVLLDGDSAPIWLWRGWIDGMTPAYLPEEKLNVVTFDCIDSLGEAGRGKLPATSAPVGVGQTASDRISAVLDLVKWSAGRRNITPVSATLNGTTYGDNAIDELTKTAESVGGSVYANPADGMITFEGIDWQNYLASQPVDGTIGNGDDGTPGYFIPGHPYTAGYLDAAGGNASTPDDAGLTITSDIVITAKVRKVLINNTTLTCLANQRGTIDNQMAWSLRMQNGLLYFGVTITGSTYTITAPIGDLRPLVGDGQDFYVGARLQLNTAAPHILVKNDPCNNFTFAPWTLAGTPTVVAGGFTGSCFQLPPGSANRIMYSVPAASVSDTLTVGVRINLFPGGSGWQLLQLRGDAGATQHVVVNLASNGTLTVSSGGVTLCTSAAGAIPPPPVNKAPVRAVTLTNMTPFIAGFGPHDGVTLVDGDRVLVTAQTSASGNGIYIAHSGLWTRATDADSESELVNLIVSVTEGATNANTVWACTTPAPVAVGTTALTFVPYVPAWIYVELTAKLGDGTSGSVTLRVDGGVVASNTACDTRNGGTNTFLDSLWVQSAASIAAWKVDDIYVRNDAVFGTAAAGHAITGLFSPDGITWTPLTTVGSVTVLNVYDSGQPVRVGIQATDINPWDGRIYWVEMRTGMVPTLGSRMFRFDADDWVSGTSFVSGGRPWTVTNGAVGMTGKIPNTPTVWVAAVDGDVCPEAWEMSHLRSETPTQVVIGRAAVAGETTPPAPYVLDDAVPQRQYGVETWTKVDLLTQDPQILLTIGNRTLKAFGANTAPRVKSVTLQPSSSDTSLRLCATASPFPPARYRCRLITEERTVFDREMFVTSVNHSLDAGRWTVRLGLDDASAFRVVG